MTAIPALSDLVREVLLEGLAGPRDPLRQIGEAERLAGELTHLGESLVGFFVELARAEGLSWADIGAPRGLSRQGAQQRYSPLLAQLTLADLVRAGTLQQFGGAAMAALHRAEAHAVRLGRPALDTGDLLLGVLDDDRSAVVGAIRELGVDPAALRPELERPGEGLSRGSSELPFGADARRALDAAVSEARGHLVAPAHLLLAVLRNPASRGGRVLAAHGVTRPAAMGAILAAGGRQSADQD